MDNILQVRDLKAYFYPSSGGIVKAVDGVSFDIERGGVFGLVGESGSGKTLTALSILRLISQPCKIMGGSILFNGEELLDKDEEGMRSIRGSSISIVFQEPASALNPVFTIGDQISEAITAHKTLGGSKVEDFVLELLNEVHVSDPKKIYHDYPHQLSGGTKQRVMIAMALANSPDLVILDEPTTALDVTIQAQILDLLKEIIKEEKLSILFISHDFGVIAKMCDHVAVMRMGKIVELGRTSQILNEPKEEYTRLLLGSVKALS